MFISLVVLHKLQGGTASGFTTAVEVFLMLASGMVVQFVPVPLLPPLYARNII
jgi:hypothetical protein